MKPNRQAQTAVEYLLLLGVVTAIVLVSFRVFIPKTGSYSELYFNQTSRALLDHPPVDMTWYTLYP